MRQFMSHKTVERNKGRTVAELLNQLGIELLGWPSISPNLNPVEHVWSLLDKMVKHKLRRLKVPPKNKKQMFRLIQQGWIRLDNKKVVGFSTFQKFTTLSIRLISSAI